MDNFSIPRSARNALTTLAVAAGITTGMSSCGELDTFEEMTQPVTQPIINKPEILPSRTAPTKFEDKLLNTKEFLGLNNRRIGDAEIDLATGERYYQFYDKDASNDSTKVYKDLFIEWNGLGHNGRGEIRDIKGTTKMDIIHKYDSPDSTKLNSHHRVFMNNSGDSLFITNPKTEEVLATIVKGKNNHITILDKEGNVAEHEFYTDGNVIPPESIAFQPSVDDWENESNSDVNM